MVNLMKKYIELSRALEEMFSPEKYLKLSEIDKANISHAEIVPPRLGENGFGKIKVHYKTPVYRL